MAGESENEFTAKLRLEASQFKAELDAIVAKLQVMGGEVKNYTASMGNDFQTGFTNIISSSSDLGQILSVFSDIATNAQVASSEMQASFNAAFAGIQANSDELRTYLTTVFDTIGRIQQQITILDPLKKASAKQPGKGAAIAQMEEELQALMNLIPGVNANVASMQSFIDEMKKVGTQSADVNQFLQVMTQALGAVKEKLDETSSGAQKTADSLKNLTSTPVKTTATTTVEENGVPLEDQTAKMAAYHDTAVQAVTSLAAAGAEAYQQMQSVMANSKLNLQQQSQEIQQILRNFSRQASTMNISTKVDFSNITNAANPVKTAAVQAQAAVTTATTNISSMVKRTATEAQQTIQTAGNNAHSYFANLGKRIVNTLTSIVISFLVYRLGRSILDFGRQCVEAFTMANASAQEFQNTLTSRGMDISKAIDLTNVVDSLAISTGFIRTDLNQAMTQMVIRFGNGQVAAKAFAVALDNARAKGMPLATSMQQVSIAALGSLKALRQFGIQSNKDLQGNLLTPMENLALMADRVKGGMESFIKTPLGQLERAKAAIDEFKTALGSVLIGVVGPFAQFFTFVLKGIADMIFGTGEVGAAVVMTKEKAVETIKTAIEWTTRLGELIASIVMMIGAARMSAGDILGGGIDIAAGLAGLNAVLKANTFLLDQLDKFSKSKEDPFKDFQTGIDKVNGLISGLDSLGEDAADAATSVGNFVAAWAPLQLLSGNLPELSKFVGNLASGFTITRKSEAKSTMAVEVHFDMSGIPSRQSGSPATQTEQIAQGKAALDNNPNKASVDAAVHQIVDGVVADLKEQLADLRNFHMGEDTNNYSYGAGYP